VVLLNHLYANRLDFVKLQRQNVPESAIPHRETTDSIVHEVECFKSHTTAVNLIVKRKYLLEHDINFDSNLGYGEDIMWVFWVYLFEGPHREISNVFYYYRQQSGSVMHNMNHKKHLDNMYKMILSFQDALNKYGDHLPEHKCKEIKTRIEWSVQNVLFDAMRLEKPIRKQTLQTLIADGLYPYPILWSRLSVHYGIKNLLTTLAGLFIPCKLYYYTMGCIFDIIRRLKNNENTIYYKSKCL
jgi:hypothetical protein